MSSPNVAGALVRASSRLRRFRRAGAAVLVAAAAAACTPDPGDPAPDAPDVAAAATVIDDWTPSASLALAPREVDGLTVPASQDGDRLALHTVSGDVEFLTGFNVGPTVPGHQPGEHAIDRATWDRWLPMIAATGVHAIRVYTIQQPHFYDALRDFNLAHPDRPLYLVHGVWIPEEAFLATEDLWDDEVVADMEAEVRDTVAVVHGDTTLADRRGHAAGAYGADVSAWTISWALGIEMDPYVTLASDQRNAGLAPHEGTFVRATADASPTESWLARMLDLLAAEEAARGRSVPLTFTNWPTTDPLDHPTEPIEGEDLVGIDANHVVTTDAWPAGRYASYHAYPYYPDFQRYEPGIADFELDGEPDSYAGYLTALREHHVDLPLLVLEFGVPTSLGNAHSGPQGRDQGGHHEADAMRIEAELLDAQHRIGAAGGFVFAWQDEWFKHTWNTTDHELPSDRRSLWHNALTNESYFGFLAIEPGAAERLTIDGTGRAWSPASSQAIHEAEAGVREVRVSHDPERLSLRILTDGQPWADDRGLTLAFTRYPDTVPGPLPGRDDLASAADHLLVLRDGQAEAFTRADADPNLRVYGEVLGFFEVDPRDLAAGSGVWTPARQIINRPLRVPGTGEQLPVEWHELNPLPHGSSDPADADFDDRAVWAASDGVLELRVPWALLGFADPSSRQGLVVGADGSLDTREVERLGIDVVIGDQPPVATGGYAWDPWNQVAWHERVKDGADVLIDRLRSYAVPTS